MRLDFSVMFLVSLLLGSPSENPDKSMRDLTVFAPRSEIMNVRLDMPRLRQVFKESKGLDLAKKLPAFNPVGLEVDPRKSQLYMGQTLGKFLKGTDLNGPQALSEILAVKQLQGWLTGFTERGKDWANLILIADRGKQAPDILPRLLPHLLKDRLITEKYHGLNIYGIPFGREQSLWCTERDGLLAVSTDNMLVKKHILRYSGLTVPEIKGDNTENLSFLKYEIDPERLGTGLIFPAEGNEEYTLYNILADTASLEKASLDYDGKNINIKVMFNEGSSYTSLLKGEPGKLAAFDVLPSMEDEVLRLYWAVDKPVDILNTFMDRLGAAIKFDKGGRSDKDISLIHNLLGTFAPDVEAAGWQNNRRRFMMFFALKDAANIRQKLPEAIRHIASKGGETELSAEKLEKLKPKQVAGAEVYQARHFIIALRKNILIFTGGYRGTETVEKYLNSFQDDTLPGKALREAYPDASIISAFNYPGMGAELVKKINPRGFILEAAGKVEENSLDIRIPLDVTKQLAKIVPLLSEAVENSRNQARALQCMNQLRQLSMGLIMYAHDNGNKLPASLKEISGKYINNQTNLFKCSLDGRPYKYVSELGGLKTTQLKNSSRTIILYHAPGATPHMNKKLPVAFLDGHIENLSAEELKNKLEFTVKNIAEIKAGQKDKKVEKEVF